MKRERSVWMKIFVPLVVAMIVQLAFIIGVIYFKGTMSELERNEMRILNQKVINRGNYLQEAMNSWAQLDSAVNAVGRIAEKYDKEAGSLRELEKDNILYSAFLEDAAPELISLLRRNSVNSVFLILSTADPAQGIGNKPGIYIRDQDTLSFPPEDNGDLLVKRMPSSVGRSMNIAYDSDWKPLFRFGDDELCYDFFKKPYEQAWQHSGWKSSDLGYWSPSYNLAEDTQSVIAYSVPLRLADGTVYGVLGIDVTQERLMKLLNYEELNEEGTGVYILGLLEEEGILKEQIVNGSSPTGRQEMKNGENNNRREGENTDNNENTVPYILTQNRKSSFLPQSYYIDGEKNEDYYASLHFLNVYHSNSPFEDEKWVLAGMVRENSLFTFSRQIRDLLAGAVLLCSLGGILIVIFVTMIISRPLMELAQSVRSSNPSIPIRLPRSGVKELNELGAAIEDLSADVHDVSTKFDQIIKMSSVEMAGFEADEKSRNLYVSEGFFELFGKVTAEESRINQAAFKKDLEALEPYIIKRSEGEILYELEDKVNSDGSGDKAVEGGTGRDVRNDIEAGTDRYGKNGMNSGDDRYVQDSKNGRYDLHGHIGIINNENLKYWIRLKIVHKNEKWYGLAENVTKEIQEIKNVEYERDYDSLTNLLNRRAFSANCKCVLEKGPESVKTCAMVMIDLDNLKLLNDNYGHEWGDRYIRLAAASIKKYLPVGSIVARMSGDEFLTFLYGYEGEDEIRHMISWLENSLSEEYLLLPDGHTYRLRMSGGIAFYPRDAQSYTDLVKYADFAMYKVKNSVKGKFWDFDRDSYLKEAYLLQNKEELNKLIEKKLVKYYFQPIIDTRTGEIFAYEALMRSALDTIPTIQEILALARQEYKLGQIERLTWFQAMEAFTGLKKEGVIGSTCRVFINSIPNQLMSVEDCNEFAALYEKELPLIVAEVTEEEKMNVDVQKYKNDLIHEWGGRIAIDDYGTGYNGQSVLIQITPEYIKIDLSFVRNVQLDDKKQTMIRNTVRYAHENGMCVIAEGVETEEEVKELLCLGADYFQGYYYGKPMLRPEPIVEEKKRRLIEMAKELYGTGLD